jgi:peptidyl-prolyl cis-trans isomerase SurA
MTIQITRNNAMTVANRIMSISAALKIRALAMLIVLAACGSAVAQSVVVFVNGDPITAVDIEQRGKLLLLTGQKTTSHQEVLDQLIDETLKVREGKRWGIVITDAKIDARYSRTARGMNYSSEQLTQILAQNGVSASTLKSRIRADMVWQQLVRARHQPRNLYTDAISALDENDAAAVDYEYVLRPILFLVPSGAGGAVYDGRREEADALRKTFKGCNESIPRVRAMHDVVVRNQVVRTSAILPDKLRKVLDGVPIGALTPPEVIRHGIEMFAVCSRNETKFDTRPYKAFEVKSKVYLRQLRENAIIERGK